MGLKNKQMSPFYNKMAFKPNIIRIDKGGPFIAIKRTICQDKFRTLNVCVCIH